MSHIPFESYKKICAQLVKQKFKDYKYSQRKKASDLLEISLLLRATIFENIKL